MIIVNLDRILFEKKIKSKDLASRINLSENNLSRIKTGNIRAIRFSTLNNLCRELDCKPGDILDYVPDDGDTPC
ncbi:MAG: helix-turn-helix transcriptional regulator [Tractidigestivibacter sp.]|uniref:helix-turn-helix domain-containing protein n=1 Tax=Tractidigestivibacter sp. TaxID=2847320 RepID=UPI002A821D99|nr:helix-turn-helix transcriptional regulator [Tractidigestivibacter sp.]MDY4535087.1 helix-turn-helix transcriptional regulator [Tractidigestivibacter sp.]